MSEQDKPCPAFDRRASDSDTSYLLAVEALRHAVASMQDAIDKLSEGYNLMNNVIFGRLDPMTNDRVVGILEQSQGSAARLDEIEKTLRWLTRIGAFIGAILLSRALGIPTERLGDWLATFVRALFGG